VCSLGTDQHFSQQLQNHPVELSWGISSNSILPSVRNDVWFNQYYCQLQCAQIIRVYMSQSLKWPSPIHIELHIFLYLKVKLPIHLKKRDEQTCIHQWQSQTSPGPVNSGQKLPQSIDDRWHDVAGREQASVTSWACIACWCSVWWQLTSKFIQTRPVKHVCSWHRIISSGTITCTCVSRLCIKNDQLPTLC